MSSNLPPGCSSPDGGIDHAYESALEALCDVADDPQKLRFCIMLMPVLDEVYRQGFEDGRADERMDHISEGA